MENLIIVLSVILAAFLSILGLVHLSRLIARVNRACTNLALIGLGLSILSWAAGLLWKILFVFTDYNFRFLDNSGYVLLAPGLVCLGWALWNSFRAIGNTPIWVVPVILIIVVEGAAIIRVLSKGGIGWFLVLLTATYVVFLAINLQLVWESLRRGFKSIASLFLVTIIFLILHYSSIRWLNFSETWFIPLQSVVMWGCFAYATWRLRQQIAA